MFFVVVLGCTLGAQDTDINFHGKRSSVQMKNFIIHYMVELINSQCINCHGLGATKVNKKWA